MKPTVSGLYWRKSLWNGFASVPVILRLDGNFLTLKTTNETEWQVFISDTKCRITPLGTMILTVNSKDYAFVTMGASVSKSFSKEQLAEISNAEGHYNAGADAAASVGLGASVAGGAAAPAGAALATLAYAGAAMANIGVWEAQYKSFNLLTSPSSGRHVGRNLALLLTGSFIVGMIILAIVRNATQ